MATVKSKDNSRAKHRPFEWLFWLQADWKR